jgi:hypothetical protein
MGMGNGEWEDGPRQSAGLVRALHQSHLMQGMIERDD